MAILALVESGDHIVASSRLYGATQALLDHGTLRLDSYAGDPALADDPVHGQHLGVLLVELGVGIAVFSVVLLIFYAFSGRSCPR